jgi:hypothetical protein
MLEIQIDSFERVLAPGDGGKKNIVLLFRKKLKKKCG